MPSSPMSPPESAQAAIDELFRGMNRVRYDVPRNSATLVYPDTPQLPRPYNDRVAALLGAIDGSGLNQLIQEGRPSVLPYSDLFPITENMTAQDGRRFIYDPAIHNEPADRGFLFDRVRPSSAREDLPSFFLTEMMSSNDRSYRPYGVVDAAIPLTPQETLKIQVLRAMSIASAAIDEDAKDFGEPKATKFEYDAHAVAVPHDALRQPLQTVETPYAEKILSAFETYVGHVTEIAKNDKPLTAENRPDVELVQRGNELYDTLNAAETRRFAEAKAVVDAKQAAARAKEEAARIAREAEFNERWKPKEAPAPKVAEAKEPVVAPKPAISPEPHLPAAKTKTSPVNVNAAKGGVIDSVANFAAAHPIKAGAIMGGVGALGAAAIEAHKGVGAAVNAASEALLPGSTTAGSDICKQVGTVAGGVTGTLAAGAAGAVTFTALGGPVDPLAYYGAAGAGAAAFSVTQPVAKQGAEALCNAVLPDSVKEAAGKALNALNSALTFGGSEPAPQNAHKQIVADASKSLKK